MTVEEWNRARSDFNHGWLKNRMIFALYRAQRILLGAVEDPTGLDDLKSLLAEWPDRCREAQGLIHDYLNYARILSTKASEISSDYIVAVSSLRWRETEHPEQRAGAAEVALKDLDSEIARLSGLSLDEVRDIHEKVRRLTVAMSDLLLDAMPID